MDLKGLSLGLPYTIGQGLARVIRAEAMELVQHVCQFSQKMGSLMVDGRRHIFPHLVPQILVGFMLLFPHTILHEAAITFLGLGLSAHQPAIGIILSESMRCLSLGGCGGFAFFQGFVCLSLFGHLIALGEILEDDGA